MARPRTTLPLSLAFALVLGCASRVPEPVVPDDIGDQLLAVGALPRPAGFEIEPGRTYYTRVGLWYEYGKHVSTNYRRGQFVPVNTPVRLRVVKEALSPRLQVRLVETGETFRIRNVEKYSRVSFATIVFRTFATRPLALDRLDPETRQSILAGNLTPGMTRFQAILARGYPPGHRTPNLLDTRWRYWRSRFRSHDIIFQDGRLSEP